MVAPTDLLNIQGPPPTNEQEQGDQMVRHKERGQNLSDEEHLMKLSTDAGFVKTVALGQFITTRDAEEFSKLVVILNVESTPYLETMHPQHQKAGFVRVRKLVLYWKW